MEKKELKVFDMFTGYGGAEFALKKARIPHKTVGYSEIDKDAIKCFENNFQLNTHAIGDRGNQYALNHYGSVLNIDNNKRWRIEHAQMVSDDDVIRFKKYNILHFIFHIFIGTIWPKHCSI